jgi:hypothetical protein
MQRYRTRIALETKKKNYAGSENDSPHKLRKGSHFGTYNAAPLLNVAPFVFLTKRFK